MRSRAAEASTFAGIAILYLVSATLISRALGFFVADPDYSYLMNGLNILSLHIPNHFDHPGTPVQAIIAFILGATWLLTLPWHGFSSLQNEVLAHPQFYMQCVNCIFAAGIATALVYFASSVRKSGGNLIPALIGIFSIFSSYAVSMTFHRIMPEPVLLGATLVLTGLLAQAIFGPGELMETRKFAAVMGVMLGFCVTAKVTAAPLLCLLFFPRSRNARKIAALAFVASAVIFLLPILPRWPIMLRGYFHILTHRGDYGSGSAGAPGAAELMRNLFGLWNADPTFFLAAAAYAAMLAASAILARPLRPNMARALFFCTAIICAGILMTAKQPHPYYLVPVVAFVCLGNTILVSALLRTFPAWVAMSLVAFLAWIAFISQYHFLETEAAEVNSDKLVLEIAAKSRCLTVFYYGVNEPQFDLYFGNLFSGQKYSTRLAQLYPKFIAYKTDAKTFQTFDKTLNDADVAKRFSEGACVHMAGIPWRPEFGIDPVALKPLAHSAGVSLYALQLGWRPH